MSPTPVLVLPNREDTRNKPPGPSSTSFSSLSVSLSSVRETKPATDQTNNPAAQAKQGKARMQIADFACRGERERGKT